MSIIDTFDPISPGIIDPYQAIRPVEGFPERVLVSFSKRFAELIEEKTNAEEISVFMGGHIIPIYKCIYKGETFAFYHTLLGAAATATFLEEVFAKGAKKALFFGSCGSLDKDLTAGKLIVPTAACRDEGVSYHYAPASDYIEIPTANRLAEIFDELGVPYGKTKTWTTDAIYRETGRNVQRRKAEGCGVVEMECAAVMAVGQFRKKEIYQFLYAADCLAGDGWDRRILGNMPEDLRGQIVRIALETAIRL